MHIKRKRLYEIIELANGHDTISKIYDFFMMGIILCSLLPLAFKTQLVWFKWIEMAAAVIFILDYIFRLVRTFRVFRIFKAFRYSKKISLLVNVFKKQKESLIVVCCLAIGYILVSALVIFNVEPETFENFFDAVYWPPYLRQWRYFGKNSLFSVGLPVLYHSAWHPVCGYG